MFSLLLRLVGVKRLDNNYVVHRIFRLIDDSGFHVRQTSQHAFYPKGLTLSVILAESYLLVSTWPEKDEIQLDLFCCSLQSLDQIKQFLNRSLSMFKPQDFHFQIMDRTTMQVVEDAWQLQEAKGGDAYGLVESCLEGSGKA